MSDRTEKDIISEAYADDAARNWRAPVQGYPVGIPWPLHLEAYAAYVKRFSKQTALIDLKGRNCRGGFGMDELDMFVPGWRDRISYIGRLEASVSELLECLKDARRLLIDQDAIDLAHIDEVIAKAEGAVA